ALCHVGAVRCRPRVESFPTAEELTRRVAETRSAPCSVHLSPVRPFNPLAALPQDSDRLEERMEHAVASGALPETALVRQVGGDYGAARYALARLIEKGKLFRVGYAASTVIPAARLQAYLTDVVGRTMAVPPRPWTNPAGDAADVSLKARFLQCVLA